MSKWTTAEDILLLEAMGIRGEYGHRLPVMVPAIAERLAPWLPRHSTSAIRTRMCQYISLLIPDTNDGADRKPWEIKPEMREIATTWWEGKLAAERQLQPTPAVTWLTGDQDRDRETVRDGLATEPERYRVIAADELMPNPEAMRTLLRECVNVAEPGERLLVAVPDARKMRLLFDPAPRYDHAVPAGEAAE